MILFLASTGVSAWAAPAPVTLAWDKNPETTVIGYKLYVGLAPGTYNQVINVGNVTQFTFSTGVVGVRYYFAVSAYVYGPLEGPKSSEISAVIQTATTTPPPPPPPPGEGPIPPPPGEQPPPPPPPGDSEEGDEPTEPKGSVVLNRASVRGSTVTLTWKPSTGLVVSEYLLEVGSRPGLVDLYNGSVGNELRITGNIGPGTYYARVRARTSSKTSLTSNEISFAVDKSGASCTAPPSTPGRPSAQLLGTLVEVKWGAVSGATSYVLQAGSASGLSDLFNADVGAYTTVGSNVPPGFQAYVRVIAVNACGRSAASRELLVK
jgi:hypothetical protein